ncbi:MAG: hypothetical protein V4463_12075 [Pseudomonadota bacterium]
MAARGESFKDHGNWAGLIGSYMTTGGQTHTMADVWFVGAPAPAVEQLVDVMRRYDANGQPAAGAWTGAEAVRLNALDNPLAKGLLASR